MAQRKRSRRAVRKTGKTQSRPRRNSGRRPRAKSNAIETALAGLAHDIRTPLTGILALAELLAAADLPQRERRWAAALKGAAEHLARLANLVVDIAKADADRLVLREVAFSPRELANSVADALRARAEAKHLRAVVTIAKNCPTAATGDEVRLRSALENLVDNAVKFTERGSIGFSVRAASTAGGRIRVTFAVSDTGIGISPADLKRLFEPFAQANDDVARRFGGAGLGLAFVKRVAAAMDGGLEVDSKVGQGSTFRLSVMLGNAARAAEPAGRVGTLRSPRGLRLLCVEDNSYGRVVLAAVLRELGHTVTFLASGEQAVAAAARGGFDVVLMDVTLAGTDGIEAARRIRRLGGKAGRIPIIGVSGRSEARDEAAALAAGMDAYLRKPASPAQLNDTLNAVAAKLRERGPQE